MHHITYSQPHHIICLGNQNRLHLTSRDRRACESHQATRAALRWERWRANPPVVYPPAALTSELSKASVLIHQLYRSPPPARAIRPCRVEQMEERRWYFSPQVTLPQPRWAEGRLGEWLNADRRTVKTKAASLYSQLWIKTPQCLNQYIRILFQAAY